MFIIIVLAAFCCCLRCAFRKRPGFHIAIWLTAMSRSRRSIPSGQTQEGLPHPSERVLDFRLTLCSTPSLSP